MTKLEKVLSMGNYDPDSLLNNSCTMDFGMRADTSLCPNGCKRCWNEECEETYAVLVGMSGRINFCESCGKSYNISNWYNKK